MDKLPFITGNNHKFYTASKVCEQFGVDLEQVEVDIDEIQHSDGVKVAEAKAKDAFETIKRPLVINDQFWSIPALGGFPGAYMKDVTHWLTTEDFLQLMKDKDDRSIYRDETVVYYDGADIKVFTHRRIGQFVLSPRGETKSSHGRVVEMEGEGGLTIAEVVDRGNWSVNSEQHKHWYDFAEWYKNQT